MNTLYDKVMGRIKLYVHELAKFKKYYYCSAAAVCVAVLGWILFLHSRPEKSIEILTAKNEFYRYEFVSFTVNVRDSALVSEFKKTGVPYYIHDGKSAVTTIGGRKDFVARYDKLNKNWAARWPCPWNARPGEYKIVVDKSKINNLNPKTSVADKKIKIVKRELPKVKKGWSVLTFENTNGLKELKVRGLDGVQGDWKNIFKWAKFINADSFLYLAAETTYYDSRLDENFPWTKHKLKDMNKAGAQANEEGVGFGAYVMVFLTFGKKELAPKKYTYAVDYDNKTGSLFTTRAISLNDSKRADDLALILKQLDDMENVDFVGIDYIRNALGGYELVDDFVREMDTATPEDWNKKPIEERMIWLAKKKIARRDMDFIDQWQWWRAHRSASIVAEAKRKSGIKKPLWAFTLSWDKGWEHGQDPVMMADAGVDYDGVMLYECGRGEFNDLIIKWNRYLKKGQANILCGDVLDWPLHQKTLLPAGPQEYFDRSVEGIDKMFGDGICDGMFVHDLQRGLWGRKGPYSTIEWMLAAGKAITYIKRKHKVLPVDCSMDLSGINKCVVAVQDLSGGAVKTIKIFVYSNKEVSFDYKAESEAAFEGKSPITFEIPYVFNASAFDRANNHFMAVRLEYEFNSKSESVVCMEYIHTPVEAVEDIIEDNVEENVTENIEEVEKNIPDSTVYELEKSTQTNQ